MPTTNVINTTLLTLYIDGSAVAHSQDASINISMSPRDITTKDSGGWRELLEGLRQFGGSLSGLYAFDGTTSPDDIFDLLEARDSVTMRFTTEETGDTFYEGDCYVTENSLESSGAEDNASFSISIEGTGTLTKGEVTGN